VTVKAPALRKWWYYSAMAARKHRRGRSTDRAAAPPAGGLAAYAPWLLVVVHALVFDPRSLDPNAPKGLVLAVGLALIGLVLARRPPVRPRLHRLDLVAAGAALLALIGEALRPPAGCGAVRPTVLLFAALWATARLAFAGRDARTLCRAAAATATVVAATCCLLHLVLPLDWRSTAVLAGVDRELPVTGLVGTFSNSNYLGGWLLLGLPALAALALDHSAARPALAVVGLTLGWTWCRSAWLVAALAVPAALALVRPALGRGLRLPALVLAVLLPLAALGLALGGSWKLTSTGTLGTRASLAEAALAELGRRPLQGWGPGGFARVWAAARPPDWRATGRPLSSLYVHNVALQLWGALGAGGLVVLVGLVAGLLGNLRAAARSGDPWGGVLALCGLAFVVDNLANVTMFVPATAAGFTVLVAAAASGEGSEPWPAGRAVAAGLVVLATALVVPMSDDWQTSRRMAEARSGCRPERLDVLVAALRDHPDRVRFAYDVAGRLALAGRLDEAMVWYDHVDALVPGYQDVRTNQAAVRRFLSEKRF